MKQGNCIGYLYDQTFLQGKLLEDEWKTDYAFPERRFAFAVDDRRRAR